MTVQKCVHKGCGKEFTDPEEDCVYHPGGPEFHEGQKGWRCCKPRVLTFDEFLTIPPCTTGKHSTIDDTPAPEPAKPEADLDDVQKPKPIPAQPPPSEQPIAQPRLPQSQPSASSSPAPPESDSDNPSVTIKPGTTCRRRGCEATYSDEADRDKEECVYHPGQALFHEGSKGWTCCKRRVLEFDEFMRIGGCKTKPRHMFVGSGRSRKGQPGGEENVESVRHDFYQTATTVIASLYLKKIDPQRAKIEFFPREVALDLPTSDNKRHTSHLPLCGTIDVEKSEFKIMGTKLELSLAKADGLAWPVLRSDERRTGEILQVGRAARA
ncbi:MAG: hypothetical protein M1833_006153 [Piccolia ochrophora]|nr:MAG: hypothetical protein M1833_006153 [Piccolia ochrophora]